MNDTAKIVGNDKFPIPLDKLNDPALKHRYYDDHGKLLPYDELMRLEGVWRECRQPPKFKKGEM